MASRFVSQVFACDSNEVIDIGLENSVLAKYEIILESPQTEVVTEALWGLSNISASSLTAHTEALLAEHSLLVRVIARKSSG